MGEEKEGKVIGHVTPCWGKEDAGDESYKENWRNVLLHVVEGSGKVNF